MYVELLGNALLYSMNYDRIVSDQVALRIGFGAFDFWGSSILTVPMTVSYLQATDAHSLEVGIGVLAASSDTGSTALGTGIFGYRYQPLDGGVVFRAGITPIFGQRQGDDKKAVFLPWVGMSIGSAF